MHFGISIKVYLEKVYKNTQFIEIPKLQNRKGKQNWSTRGLKKYIELYILNFKDLPDLLQISNELWEFMILFSKVKCPWYWRLNVLSHLPYRRPSPRGSVGPRWSSCRKFAKLPGTWNPENVVRNIYFFHAKNFSVIFLALSVSKSLSFMFFAFRAFAFMFYFSFWISNKKRLILLIGIKNDWGCRCRLLI